MGVEGVERGRIRSLAAFVDAVAKVPLIFEPGERYEYSYCTDVLGRVLEVASNRSLDRLLQEKLFGPLGMSDTGFSVPAEKQSRLAAIYGNAITWAHLNAGKANAVPVTTKPGLVRLDGLVPEASAWAQGCVRVCSGGGLVGHNRGGLVSTARDTEAFVRMLLNDGIAPDGQRLLSKKMLAQMERNMLVGNLRSSDGARWCLLGDMVDEDSRGSFQQGGAAGNYWLVDRKRQIAVIVFMQQVDGEDWSTLGFDSDKAELDKVMKDFCSGHSRV